MLSSLYARKAKEDGFTLIELLVVVIIIGILAAIALPIFIDQQKVAIDASVQSDVRNSVTNITNGQAQKAASVKLTKSRDETSVKVFEGTSTDPEPEADGLTIIPQLGTSYKVEGKNAGGKKYATQVFQFDSSTGKFGSADATVPAGVVVSSTTFDDGAAHGWTVGSTPAVYGVQAVDGHPFAFRSARQVWAGYQQNVSSSVDYSKKLLAGKTYTITADVYLAPGTTVTGANVHWDLFGAYVDQLTNLTPGWQKITTTITPNFNDYIYTSFYANDGTNSNSATTGLGLDMAFDNIIYTQMD